MGLVGGCRLAWLARCGYRLLTHSLTHKSCALAPRTHVYCTLLLATHCARLHRVLTTALTYSHTRIPCTLALRAVHYIVTTHCVCSISYTRSKQTHHL